MLVHTLWTLTLTLSLTLSRLFVVLVIPRGLLVGLHTAVRISATPIQRLLRQRLGVDIHDRRAHFFGNLHKFVGRNRRVHDLQGRGIGAVGLFFLSADPMSSKRSSHNGQRERAKQNKR